MTWIGTRLVAEAHHRTLAELLVDLGERDVERLRVQCWHRVHLR
jgi:hypothetical protein